MATLKDVAKRAGVSYNTVSLVINNSNKVAKETRERVLEVIKELNYTPNKIAKALVKGKADAIAFITSRFTSELSMNILKELEEGIFMTGYTHNYDLIPYSTMGKENLKNEILNNILNSRKANVIIMLSIKPDYETLKKLLKEKIYIILLDEKMEDTFNINIDNIKGAYIATEYLIKHGRKKIIYIGGKLDLPENCVKLHCIWHCYKMHHKIKK